MCDDKHLNLRQIYILSAKGFIMGCADVIPGVSGGTMALILGIYEKLINSIRCINRRTLKFFFQLKLNKFFKELPWQFLASVFGGVLLAVFTLAKLLEYLLENHRMYVSGFFFGLVLSSVFFIRKKIKKRSASTAVLFLVGTFFSYYITGLVPSETPNTHFFVFLSGMIAICAMILPGISGSFLLVIMGKYQQILHAVNNYNFVTLFIFMLGAGVGIIVFAKFLSWLLSRHHDGTMGLLLGLMLGSLRKIWPWKAGVINIFPDSFDNSALLVLILIILGFVLVWALQKISRNTDIN